MKREEIIQRTLTYLTFAETWFVDASLGNERGWSESQLRFVALPLNYFNSAEILTSGEVMEAKSYETMVFNPFNEDNREMMTMDIGMW